jgi:S-adenosylmethionine hydrolase
MTMVPEPVITLTTDFGDADGYVGAVKGVMLSICPQAKIIDIAHHITPHDVIQAAIALESAAGFFPPGTVHTAVVDPGVGTGRRRILALSDQAFFVGPDNGIFGLVFAHQPPRRIFSIENDNFMLKGEATTFDGRDVFAPVAAYIANGLDPAEIGPEITDPVPLGWPENAAMENGLTGAIVTIDRFGNLITSIHRRDFPEGIGSFVARIKDRSIAGPAVSYYDAGRTAGEEFRVLFGSSGYLEIASPGTAAMERLAARRGDVVDVRW